MTRRSDPTATPVPAGGLLTVHAHPDDETLSNGALLATWAAAGLPVTVVTCTRGEQGEVIGEAFTRLQGDGVALAMHRERELASALTALGVRDHVFLDTVALAGATAVPDTVATADGEAPAASPRYVDSGMAWVTTGQAATAPSVPPGAFVSVPVDEAATRLAAVLRDRRPEVVVCDEPGGGYGHPDHVHAHRVVRRALELAASAHEVPGEPHRVPAALWTVLDEAALRAGYAVLRALAARMTPLSAPDAAGPVPSAARGAEDVDVVVPVAPVLHRVLAALGAHATQVQAVQEVVRPRDADVDAPSGGVAVDPAEVAAVYALSNEVLAPLLATETYQYAPGYPQAVVCWPGGVTAVASRPVAAVRSPSTRAGW